MPTVALNSDNTHSQRIDIFMRADKPDEIFGTKVCEMTVMGKREILGAVIRNFPPSK